jgi:hypothetical protein
VIFQYIVPLLWKKFVSSSRGDAKVEIVVSISKAVLYPPSFAPPFGAEGLPRRYFKWNNVLIIYRCPIPGALREGWDSPLSASHASILASAPGVSPEGNLD